jgi:hypothetical protein
MRVVLVERRPRVEPERDHLLDRQLRFLGHLMLHEVRAHDVARAVRVVHTPSAVGPLGHDALPLLLIARDDVWCRVGGFEDSIVQRFNSSLEEGIKKGCGFSDSGSRSCRNQGSRAWFV